MKRIVSLFITAVQFATRVPVPRRYTLAPSELASAAAFLPLVGAGIALGGVAIHAALEARASREITAFFVLTYLVVVTGGLHEDGLADTVDGLGGAWNRQQALAIMRDSRIGSFGALAITLSLLGRFLFLAGLPPAKFAAFLIAGQSLSRWSVLPLGFFLGSARGPEGQGALVARRITGPAFFAGTALAIAIVAFALGGEALWPALAASAIVAGSGAYYRSQIGGVTGDCLGATMQITEAAVYCTGVLAA